MLRLSDFVTGRKRFYYLSRGLCISDLKHSRTMKFRICSSDISKQNLLLMSLLSDFMACSSSL